MFFLAPFVSIVLAYAAVIHSLSLFFLRYNSCEHESVAIAVASLVVDAMTIPMTYYFIYFKWQAVSLHLLIYDWPTTYCGSTICLGMERDPITAEFIPHYHKLYVTSLGP